jgi:hypothetical protein
MDWQPVADEIDALIAAYTDEGVSAGLVGDPALVAAERLWTGARDDDGVVPLGAARTVARLYWFRAQAFGVDTRSGRDDLGAASAFSP